MRTSISLVFGLLVSTMACAQINMAGRACYWANEGDTTYLQRPGVLWELKDSLTDGLWNLVSQGRLLQRGPYVGGKRDGTFSYYSYQGELTMIQSFKAGVLDGPYLIFHLGQLQTSGTYTHGAKSGTWYSWDESWQYSSDSSSVLSRKWGIVSEQVFAPR